ncbi:MAG: 50S ribosomal protein L11 methyltransferase [Robiginitomaculum sp.]|nr:50S ribosomal protein L11 methyltransferase [Robiginitomaculum sp.]
MGNLWQISLFGTKSELQQIENSLQDSLPPPLSFSLFEDDLPIWRLEIIVDQQPIASEWRDLADNIKIEKLPAKNWVLESLRFLTPVIAGRFYVHGSHDEPSLARDKVSVCIPANIAFGTGHHETTSGCLLEFDQMLRDGLSFSNIIDLGSGAGILAIAAAKTLNAKIIATDIDPETIPVAEGNALSNDVVGKIEFIIADGVDHKSLQAGVHDLVFANILAMPLIEMAEGISNLLASSGYLILAGLLNEQAEAVASTYKKHDMKIIRSRIMVVGQFEILFL